MYHKQRKLKPDFGGGVALLVKEGITHTLVDKLIQDSEVIGINVDYGKTKFNLFTYYNPPNLTLDKSVLQTLVNLEDDLILVGDLNARAKSFGCKRYNESGLVLEEFLVDEEVILCNDHSQTYLTFKPEKGYSEILDLVLTTTNISSRVIRYQALEQYTMGSDQCPVSFYLKLNNKPLPLTASL